jgi:hypothetical protein
MLGRLTSAQTGIKYPEANKEKNKKKHCKN